MRPHDLLDLVRTRRLLAIVRGDGPGASALGAGVHLGAGTVLTARDPRDAATLDLVSAA
ncbi:hypothetical protein [Microbispora bryophytorum]|uniref:PucR family transcriptional regulator n=1 Tax=Microbispora bryophytorum subsp. camponoti TaxID=1677852 RepID=A0ABR8L9V3_9ACTN|nr:hypothetical protein [Microbispora camponoti]MBD3145284.1 hypothetical protein [Microbispora camponoti]